MPKIYIIHENDEWTEPLRIQLQKMGLPFEEWYLNEGRLDLSVSPPPGVFYNRMSASSHTRDHRFSAEYTAAVLSWLEGHGRRVINSSRALQLEISKVAQYAALHAHGIRTPRTISLPSAGMRYWQQHAASIGHSSPSTTVVARALVSDCSRTLSRCGITSMDRNSRPRLMA